MIEQKIHIHASYTRHVLYPQQFQFVVTTIWKWRQLYNLKVCYKDKPTSYRSPKFSRSYRSSRTCDPSRSLRHSGSCWSRSSARGSSSASKTSSMATSMERLNVGRQLTPWWTCYITGKDRDQSVRTGLINFAEAFDHVDHNILVAKLKALGLPDTTSDECATSSEAGGIV